MTLALTLIFLAGVAEFLKDLSEEGKLKGYWDKKHMVSRTTRPVTGISEWTPLPYKGWPIEWNVEEEQRFWKVGWLQGWLWDWLPVWIRQYLAFRDGWHLLKFFSLTLGTFGMLLLGWEWFRWVDVKDGWWTVNVVKPMASWGCPWWVAYVVLWLPAWLTARTLFSTPETLGRIIYKRTQ